ncbi:hypothetical protein RRL34_004264 [Vibrio parahaemolyticus]|nr:hypothetical protein [Vibrio parahaemolyticus]
MKKKIDRNKVKELIAQGYRDIDIYTEMCISPAHFYRIKREMKAND